MNRLFLIVPVLSFLILAAHSLRASNYVLMGLWLFMMVMVVFSRKDSVMTFCAGALAAGAVMWVENAWQITHIRMMMGAPYTRLILILGGVLIIMAMGIYYLCHPGKKDNRQEGYEQD